MTQTEISPQTTAKPSSPAINQQPIQPHPMQLPKQQIKELIVETLIELNLIPKAEKKKAISID